VASTAVPSTPGASTPVPSESTKAVALLKRGDPERGDWVDPRDYNGNREEFMAQIPNHRRIREVPWAPVPEGFREGDEDAPGYRGMDPGMTTSTLVAFRDKAEGIAVTGIFGCTAIFVVSTRGAWAAHIWETPFMKYSDPENPNTRPFIRKAIDAVGEAGVESGQDGYPYHPYGLKQLFNGGGRNPAPGEYKTLFGEEDDETDVHVFIFTPRPRHPEPSVLPNGRPSVPDSVRLNPNYNAGQQLYEAQVAQIRQNIEGNIFDGVDVTVHEIDYAARLPTFEQLKAQWAHQDLEQTYLRLAQEAFDNGDYPGSEQYMDASASERQIWLDMLMEVNADSRAQGKVLLQYQPAKPCPRNPRERKRPKAMWRLYHENNGIIWHEEFAPEEFGDGTSQFYYDSASASSSRHHRKRQTEDGKSCPPKDPEMPQYICSQKGCSDRPESCAVQVEGPIPPPDASKEVDKRGDPDFGDWVEPWDEPFASAADPRDEWMARWDQHKYIVPLQLPPRDDPELPQTEMVTSKTIVFEDDVASIGVEGMFGCTTIVAVSKRGAWVGHIFESHMIGNNYDNFANDKVEIAYSPWNDDKHLKYHRYGLAQLYDGGGDKPAPEPLNYMFGKTDSDYDADVHVFIVMPRPKADPPEFNVLGEPYEPDEERMKSNLHEGELLYPDHFEDLQAWIRDQILEGINVRFYPVDYAPLVLPAEHWKTASEFWKKAEAAEQAMDASEEGSAEYQQHERDMIANMDEWDAYGPSILSDPKRETPRGKLIVQYQPAKPDDPDCPRDHAEWRVAFEDWEIDDSDNYWVRWKPEPNQIWKGTSNLDDDGSDVEMEDPERKIKRQAKKGGACSVRNSTSSTSTQTATTMTGGVVTTLTSGSSTMVTTIFPTGASNATTTSASGSLTDATMTTTYTSGSVLVTATMTTQVPVSGNSTTTGITTTSASGSLTDATMTTTYTSGSVLVTATMTTQVPVSGNSTTTSITTTLASGSLTDSTMTTTYTSGSVLVTATMTTQVPVSGNSTTNGITTTSSPSVTSTMQATGVMMSDSASFVIVEHQTRRPVPKWYPEEISAANITIPEHWENTCWSDMDCRQDVEAGIGSCAKSVSEGQMTDSTCETNSCICLARQIGTAPTCDVSEKEFDFDLRCSSQTKCAPGQVEACHKQSCICIEQPYDYCDSTNDDDRNCQNVACPQGERAVCHVDKHTCICEKDPGVGRCSKKDDDCSSVLTNCESESRPGCNLESGKCECLPNEYVACDGPDGDFLSCEESKDLTPCVNPVCRRKQCVCQRTQNFNRCTPGGEDGSDTDGVQICRQYRALCDEPYTLGMDPDWMPSCNASTRECQCGPPPPGPNGVTYCRTDNWCKENHHCPAHEKPFPYCDLDSLECACNSGMAGGGGEKRGLLDVVVDLVRRGFGEGNVGDGWLI